MPLTNPGTAFDEDGWADAISDIRKLFLLFNAIKGGGNDTNNTTLVENQIQATIDLGRANKNLNIYPKEVDVCVEGTRQTMHVLGTDPA